MNHFIPFFKEEELIGIGQASLEIKFQDKQLIRYLTFAKPHVRKAINICQQDIAAGVFCLLTEGDTHFAIWREQPSKGKTFSVKVTPKVQPKLNKLQLSRQKEKELSSQVEALEFVFAAFPPVSDVNYVAETSQIIEINEVSAIDSSFSSEALPHQKTLAPAKTNTSINKIKISNTYSTSRSTFLSRLNLELTQHIGSKADYLINKLLAERPNIQPQEMIEAIAAELPNPKESKNIQKNLERLAHYFSVK